MNITTYTIKTTEIGNLVYQLNVVLNKNITNPNFKILDLLYIAYFCLYKENAIEKLKEDEISLGKDTWRNKVTDLKKTGVLVGKSTNLRVNKDLLSILKFGSNELHLKVLIDNNN